MRDLPPTELRHGTRAISAFDQHRFEPANHLALHRFAAARHGPGLADNRPDFLANGRHWRTPPLWGVGLVPDVNGHQRLLHDVRANGVLEAILWHAGEAQDSQQTVLKFNASERAALVKFVESL